jgi:hypothetical protein
MEEERGGRRKSGKGNRMERRGKGEEVEVGKRRLEGIGERSEED